MPDVSRRESVASRMLAERVVAQKRAAQVPQFEFTFAGGLTDINGEKAVRVCINTGSLAIERALTLSELTPLIESAQKARVHWLRLSLLEPTIHQANHNLARSNYNALVTAKKELEERR